MVSSRYHTLTVGGIITETVMKCVVVEAVKLILMILCSSNIITRRNWTNSGTEGEIFTTRNRLTENERFVLCWVRSWHREKFKHKYLSLKTFSLFASFFPLAKFSIVIRHHEAEAVRC